MKRFAEEFSRMSWNISEKDTVSVMRLKKEISRRFGFSDIPKNGNILEFVEDPDRERIASILRSKPIRTLSGVSVLALMTKPFACPHGKCIFCPGGVEYGTPQSYTGFEPAARRARVNEYDPYLQVEARLKQYAFMGYNPQKVEVIVIGGTFTTLPEAYKTDFVTQIYRALNEFSSENRFDGGLEEQKAFLEGNGCHSDFSEILQD